jgi:DNA processing protein
VLVALVDVVVIVQAGEQSGTLNAASRARTLGRPLWVVPSAPWVEGFEGSRALIREGARCLTSIDELLGSLSTLPAQRPRPSQRRRPSSPIRSPRQMSLLPGADTAPRRASLRPLTADEITVISSLSPSPSHLDEIAVRTHLSAQAIATALLTLALEDVVVEGPAGFYRRGKLL